MNGSRIVTGDQLANALRGLGVNFIMGGEGGDDSLRGQPACLIAALAESDEARLRLSLIPLFLEYPEFEEYARSVAKELGPPARLTLQCYYSAAVWLQQKYRQRFNALIGEKPSLPDHFWRELDLQNTNDAEENLRRLAQRHRALSGAQVNWLGT